jgi:hypothetical protein
MTDFTARTSSNLPLLKDPAKLAEVLEGYEPLGIRITVEDGRLGIHGFDEPEVARELHRWREENPHLVNEEVDEEEEAELRKGYFRAFLLDIAPLLREPLVVRCVGGEGLRWPLYACEWTVHPNDRDVTTKTFGAPLPPVRAVFTLDGERAWEGTHVLPYVGLAYPMFARPEAEAILSWHTERHGGSWEVAPDGRSLLHWRQGQREGARYAPQGGLYPIGCGDWPWRLHTDHGEAAFEAHLF